MKNTSVSTFSTIALLCCITSGCVTCTTYRDEPRRKVRFSSARTAQTFYDAYASIGTPIGSGILSVGVGFPMPLPYRRSTVPTENVKFNAAIQAADTDHNGVISEQEARTYAAQIAADRQRQWEEKKAF